MSSKTIEDLILEGGHRKPLDVNTFFTEDNVNSMPEELKSMIQDMLSINFYSGWRGAMIEMTIRCFDSIKDTDEILTKLSQV
jgi:hypothetical protein